MNKNYRGGVIHYPNFDQHKGRNSEHYNDSTAEQALSNIEARDRKQKILRLIWDLLDENDMQMVGRITIYDKKTKRYYE